MRSLTSATRPPRSCSVRPPSPSTRASAATVIVRLLFLFVLIGVARGPEGRRPGVVAAEGAHQLGSADAELLLPEAAERCGGRRLGRPEAAVAAAGVGRAERATARLGDGAEAGRAVGGRPAHGAAALALEAHGPGRELGLAAVEQRSQQLEQLVLADRTAAQLVVDARVLRDRRRGGERVDVLGRRVHRRGELAHVGEVPERLDPAGGGAGPDRDQPARLLAHLLDAGGVVGGGDRALDERDVVRAFHHLARSLEEVRDLELARDREQLLLAVEERQLAAVAGGELEDRELRARA